MTRAEVVDLVTKGRRAQAKWAALPVAERCRRLKGFRDLLIAETDQLVELISAETGKPRQEALLHDVSIGIDIFGYFLKHGARILAPERIPLHLLKHRKSVVHYLPAGVVGILAPWNLPMAIPFGEVAMALIAGNAVVLKPSERAPLISVKLQALFRQACAQSEKAAGPSDDLTPELFQVAIGDGAIGRAVIESGIDLCIFTGSTATGKKVAAACAERLIPCILELGGKCPAIVCDDADLDRTAAALVWGGFANSGQLCVSVERVYVAAGQPFYDALVAKIVAETRALRQGVPLSAAPTGDGVSAEVDVGSMAWQAQRDIVEAQVADAVAKGATILTGGARPAESYSAGYFYPPTVLTGCTHDMAIMTKESFGPVLPMMRVDSTEEALRLANDSHLGLMGYIFSKNRKRAEALALRLEAGTVMINDVLHTFGLPETPWGGIKQSGYGRTHSDQGLRDLCQIRHVNSERIGSLKRDPYWFPYGSARFKQFYKILKWLTH